MDYPRGESMLEFAGLVLMDRKQMIVFHERCGSTAFFDV